MKSLLGMTQYVACFIPNYATITARLRLLTRRNTPWKWEQEEQRALNELKEALVGDQVMSYFDRRKQSEIIVHAKPRWSWRLTDARLQSYKTNTSEYIAIF